ncbi:MAG TPA: RNA 2',3'-cyclic phosphodiesterase [Hyphomicrobiales bacterium]|nr:RNA 2',3'-cyclic phosphodiesterase [Hyphomicrobiales bacterium]
MPRLFTALEIPDDIARDLALAQGGLAGARWIDAADYHITLRFIGDIDADLAHEIANALDGVRRPPLTVTLDGYDAFGGDRPRALIAKVKPTAELRELQAEHERLIRRAGVPPESRKFTPHVTLARLRRTPPRDAADWLAARPVTARRTFEASRFVLFSSRASVGGGPYVVEAAYPLRSQ